MPRPLTCGQAVTPIPASSAGQALTFPHQGGRECADGQAGRQAASLFAEGGHFLLDSQLHLSHVGHAGIVPDCLSVKDEVTVNIDLQPSLTYGRQGDCQLAAKLTIEFGPYPRGLGEVPSG